MSEFTQDDVLFLRQVATDCLLAGLTARADHLREIATKIECQRSHIDSAGGAQVFVPQAHGKLS